MATSNNFSVDLTNCCLCFEKYKTPRTLPCTHNVCHSCLSAHIKSSCEHSDPPLGFSCPICRTFVPGPGVLGQYSLDDWANHFPENQFINLKVGKLASMSSVSCGPCETVGENGLKVESWCWECTEALCEKCTQIHKKFKALQTHQIIPLSISELNVNKTPQQLLRKWQCCEKHEKRNIELICYTHQALCCSLCIVHEHKHCDNFSTITQAADAYSDDEKMKLVEDIEQFSSKIDLLLQDEKQNITDLENKMDTGTEEIHKMIEEMVNQLRKKEEEYLNELAATSKEGKKKLEDSVSSLEQRKMYLAHWLEYLTPDTKDQTKETLIIKCLKTKKAMKEVKALPLIRTDIDFSVEMPNGLEKINSLGTLFSVKSTENNINLNDIQNAPIKTIVEFKIESQDINGGSFLPNGQLLLCDCSSPRCLVFTENGSLLREIELPGNPWDVFIESDGRILITLPEERKIVVLQKNTLVVEKTIELLCECRGITKQQDNYLIGTTGTIEEFSSDFTHLESRSVDITDDIAVENTGCIVFGDYDGTVTKEDKDHKVLFTYKHAQLTSLNGLAIDKYGFIFVNDKDSGNIHILSEDGHLLRFLECADPQCIKFEENSQRFFVVSCQGDVKIFKTSW